MNENPHSTSDDPHRRPHPESDDPHRRPHSASDDPHRRPHSASDDPHRRQNETKIFVTPSDVIEYLFCPRFLYYMHTLKIEQHEHKRTLVNKGRDIHALKMVSNKDYLRKKIGCLDKEIDVYLSSEKFKLVGRIDEVLFFENDYAAPLDYKFAFWENRIYNTHKIQQTLYALLIEENFDKLVEKAFLVFVRSKNHLEEIAISLTMKKKALGIVEEIFDILNLNYFPQAAKSKNKCLDCTYRNLCAV